jgi:hypothetical protein
MQGTSIQSQPQIFTGPKTTPTVKGPVTLPTVKGLVTLPTIKGPVTLSMVKGPVTLPTVMKLKAGTSSPTMALFVN